MSEIFSKLGSYLRAHTVWVLLPGILVLCEIWLIANWGRLTRGPGQSPVEVAYAQTKHINLFVGAIGIIVGLAIAYGIGSFARSITWSIWSFFNRRRPFLTGQGIIEDLAYVYGYDAVRKIVDAYPALRAGICRVDQNWNEIDEREIEKDQAVTAPENELRRTFDPPHRYLLSFCKLWLASKQPVFSIDQFENEINVLLVLVIPVWLTPGIALRAGGLDWFGVVFALALGTTAVIFWLTHLKQRDELFQAVKHLLFAQWLEPEKAADERRPH